MSKRLPDHLAERWDSIASVYYNGMADTDRLEADILDCLHTVETLEKEVSVLRGNEEPEPDWDYEAMACHDHTPHEAHLWNYHMTTWRCPGKLDPLVALQDLRERVELIETMLRSVVNYQQHFRPGQENRPRGAE